MAGEGVFFNHDERYELTDEFLKIWRQLFTKKKSICKENIYKLKGDNYHTLRFKNHIHHYTLEVLHSGALDVAAEHVDVYLTWGEPPAQVEKKITKMRELAAAQGRTLKFGIRLHASLFVQQKRKHGKRLIS